MSDDVVTTVEGFYLALQRGDIDACIAMFTGDGIIWHNYDCAEQPNDEALGALRGLAQLKPRYIIWRRDVLTDGCVQQHVVELSLPGGGIAAVPAMQRIYCADRKISRIEEYMDSAQMAEVIRSLQSIH
jgi:ketosteroid isomerase-like protein